MENEEKKVEKSEKIEKGLGLGEKITEPLPSRNPEGNEDYARRKRFVEFGPRKMLIGTKDLGNNILNVKYNSRASIIGLLKTRISPLFSSIIHSYVMTQPSLTQTLTEETFVEHPQTKNLSEEEKELMGMFLKRTCVRSGPIKNAISKANIADKKRELKIMLGIRQAGNNSQEMAMNILKVAKYLKTKGQLSREMLRDILTELSKDV